MTIQAAFTLILLAATLLVMASQRLRADLVSLLVLLTLILSGLVTPAEAFGAFGQPVIIIVAAIYVLGAALFETGVANIIALQMLRFGGRGEAALLLLIVLVSAAMSAFLMGMLVVAVLLPAILRIARTTGIARSRFLLALAHGSIIGNQLTLIGTSSNLVISDLLRASGGQPLGLFSLTPYALVSVAIVALWYTIPGRRLLSTQAPDDPERPSLEEVARSYGLDNRLFKVRVRSMSPLIGNKLSESSLRRTFELSVVAVQKGPKRPPRSATPDYVAEQDHLLYVQGKYGDVLQAAARLGLEVKREAELDELAGLDDRAIHLSEVIVPFRSRLVGSTLADARFRDRFGLAVLAVHRQGQIIREDLQQLTLQAGDTLLVQGPGYRLRQIGEDFSLVPVTSLGPQPGDLVTGKAGLALGILAALIVISVTGWLDLAVASALAAMALILTGCVSLEKAYRSVDGSVLVIVAGMLPLSLALERTGVAGLIADVLASFSAGFGPMAGLLLLYLIVTLITQVVSNTVTAALVMPVAISLATIQGLSPLPFAIAMAFAVNAAYVTPLTDSNNLLVREPGRYVMRDFLIHGLPIYLLQSLALFLMLAARLN